MANANREDYKLIVTYEVTEDAHNGYCSDPEREMYRRKSKMKESYALPAELPDHYVENETEIPTEERALRKFEIETEKHMHPYCPGKTQYDLVKAKVVRK